MIKIILLILFYLAFPLVIIYLCNTWTIFKKIGTIVLAYAFGLILGISGLLPKGSDGYIEARQGRTVIPSEEIGSLLLSEKIIEKDVFVNSLANAQDMLTSVVVPLAFPLLLFSLNVKRWLKFAKEGMLSMFLALVSVIAIVVSGYFIFRSIIPDTWKVAGMLVGLYTGGTPNLVSLKVAMDVNTDLFVLTSAYDMIVGAFVLVFFLTAGPRIFRKILPPFNYKGEVSDIEIAKTEAESFDDFSGMFSKERILPLLKALGFSLIIFIIGFGVSLLLPNVSQMVVVILSITTLAIAASLVPSINKIEKSFQLGMYFILVFSFCIASMADMKTLINANNLSLILYITYAYFGSLFLHMILSKIFKVNADDFLITTTTFLFSPPFVPVMAGALRNKEVILTGITVGILGYVIGNYLGVGLGFLLKSF
jgi:uncharacterized membrane protein